MHFLVLLFFVGYFHVLQTQAKSEEISVTRHPDGDIFTIEESCSETCLVLSSGTASPFSYASSSDGVPVLNSSCTCQCNPKFPLFREDLNICVDDIHECNAAGFVSESLNVWEKVPYVYLPQRGQIIYPNAEIRFPGVKVPICGVAGAQQLNRGGWSELRNLSNAEPPFRLFRDEGRTYLQWVGDSGLRDAAEGRVVVARLVCRDADPEKLTPDVFTPCVAFRVAGSPARNSIREVVFIADTQSSQGLSTVEYTAIGLSSIILALIYIASVLLYLQSRKAKRKQIDEPESGITGNRDNGGVIKNNPLLSAGRHFESDTNSGLSESEIGDDLPQSDGEQGFENITSAVIHPQFSYVESEGIFSSSSILGERLPEEDVRIVETIDNTQQQDNSTLPGTQRRKLYFNPAYFERQLLLAPPPAAIEFLFKIREVISIAKHKMAAKKFVPTLIGIPEEESNQDRNGNRSGLQRRESSVQGSVTKSKKSQDCTGCPGCRDLQPSTPSVPTGSGGSYLCLGESRIRAWLEDVKPPEKKWKIGIESVEESRKNFEENARSFAKNLEYLKEMEKGDFTVQDKGSKSMSSYWKENPPMLKTFQNITRSEILENNIEDNLSISKRSTRSMFEESDYSKYYNLNSFDIDNTVNAKVRKAIENSFIKQMEENATLNDDDDDDDDDDNDTKKKDSECENNIFKVTTTTPTNSHESLNCSNPSTPTKKLKKSRAPLGPKKLPDMIKELPASKYPAKKLMDEVIQEMVVAKALDHHRPLKSNKSNDYEVDSLERSKSSLKSSSSPDSTNRHSSPALSTALPLDEELTMQNAIYNVNTGAMTMSKLKNDSQPAAILGELILPTRQQSYSLVSEVYVNDGYTSPAGSDCSGPEIQYEKENPGHLTIKVIDSPENYVKQDDSEYEPDTLDRKPMKLKINEDMSYEKEGKLDEVYIDSLERPAQILLRSKGSFRTENNDTIGNSSVGGSGGVGNGVTPFQRNYGSLREIYEARLRSNLKNSALLSSTRSLNGDMNEKIDGSSSWSKIKYLTPEMKHAKRQRKPQNHPDVVPIPNSDETIYQQPKVPRSIKNLSSLPKQGSKNGRDRSRFDTGNPTASGIASVPIKFYHVGRKNDDNYSFNRGKISLSQSFQESIERKEKFILSTENKNRLSRTASSRTVIGLCDDQWLKNEYKKNNITSKSQLSIKVNSSSSTLTRPATTTTVKNMDEKLSRNIETKDKNRVKKNQKPECLISEGCITLIKNGDKLKNKEQLNNNKINNKIEDSGYLSSTDSNGSQKRLLNNQEVSSVSETDETESICDGASESGAESVGTDSVFFGHFRKLSELSNFSKSIDSGVNFTSVRNPYFQAFGMRNEGGVLERQRESYVPSDSESDSFMTVLPALHQSGSKRNSLVL